MTKTNHHPTSNGVSFKNTYPKPSNFTGNTLSELQAQDINGIKNTHFSLAYRMSELLTKQTIFLVSKSDIRLANRY